MAIKSIKCPSCAANIEIDDNREFGFCNYCGSKIQVGERLNVHVTHEYPNGAPQVNNVTINNAASTAPTFSVKKPSAARIVWGIIMLVFGAMFALVTIQQNNYTGWFITIPVLIGGVLLIVFYFVSLNNYNKMVMMAAQQGLVTNRK